MDYKAPLLEEALTAYEKENELFDRKKFDDMQVLSVVFKAMDLVENLAIHDVSQQRELLKKWWEYFDKESVAVNCNEQEREEVITNFFNCG